jgi:hypothetical protein
MYTNRWVVRVGAVPSKSVACLRLSAELKTLEAEVQDARQDLDFRLRDTVSRISEIKLQLESLQ